MERVHYFFLFTTTLYVLIPSYHPPPRQHVRLYRSQEPQSRAGQ
jgi:hypothetical protein